jgi:3-oxoacyl-[acyl-carrier protein] reductase
MDLGLAGKNAVVIASSQGLGKAIAKQLAKVGANVTITSRDIDKLEGVKTEILKETGNEVFSYPCDITKPEEISQLIVEVKERFGSIDILVNNAGGPPGGKFEDFDDTAWQNAFELNLLSYVRTIREALPLMKENGGKVINIASSSIKVPISGLILSNVFRLGIVGLTKTLAEELAPYNILINTVAPGTIATDRISHLNNMRATNLGVSVDEVEKRTKAGIPLGRYGEPEEFAKVVTFLASEANSYMTGSSFYVDGGAVKAI